MGLRYCWGGSKNTRGSDGVDHAELINRQMNRVVVRAQIDRNVAFRGEDNGEASVIGCGHCGESGEDGFASEVCKTVERNKNAPMNLRRMLRTYAADEPGATTER